MPAADRALRGLVWLMFLVTAMTTNVVGVLIPEVARTYGGNLTRAGGLQYATMAGIAVAGLFLGGLADRRGRRPTVLAGLALFALASFLIALGDGLAPLLALLFVSGLAIGVFKTGGMALIGDLSRSPAEHTRAMNLVEGFFAVGAVAGPPIVAALLAAGLPWSELYGLAGVLTLGLLALAATMRFPPPRAASDVVQANAPAILAIARDPHALGFGACIFLYVGVETAVYVWMPSLLAAEGDRALLPGAYALSTFFVLRAAGRFLGAWTLERLGWTRTLAACAAAVLACFAGALAGGRPAATVLLPLSGLFMSVLYPTLNSKAISGFPAARHGAAAGFILFVTCLSAVVSPLAIGAVSDALGGPRAGFALAAAMALALAAALVFNLVKDPSRARLAGGLGAAAAHDQLDRRQGRGGDLARHAAEEQVDHGPRAELEVLPDGGQRRRAVTGQDDVVEADHGHVVRDCPAGRRQGADCGQGDHVREGEGRVERDALGEERRHRLLGFVHRVGRRDHQGRIERDPRFRQTLPVAFEPLDRLGSVYRAQEGDALAALGDQMGDGQASALDVVASDRAVALARQPAAPDHHGPVGVGDGVQRLVLGALADQQQAVGAMRLDDPLQPARLGHDHLVQ